MVITEYSLELILFIIRTANIFPRILVEDLMLDSFFFLVFVVLLKFRVWFHGAFSRGCNIFVYTAIFFSAVSGEYCSSIVLVLGFSAF